MRLSLLAFLAIIPTLPLSSHAQSEAEILDRWCGHSDILEGPTLDPEDGGPGTTEHTLTDRTRVDCLTDTHVIEAEFAFNWAEAAGQARHYAISTHDRRPGILLIVRDARSDWRYVPRLAHTLTPGIRLWVVHRADFAEP